MQRAERSLQVRPMPFVAIFAFAVQRGRIAANKGLIAQRSEQATQNRPVAGSNPAQPIPSPTALRSPPLPGPLTRFIDLSPLHAGQLAWPAPPGGGAGVG